jgi:hypothetical protein
VRPTARAALDRETIDMLESELKELYAFLGGGNESE